MRVGGVRCTDGLRVAVTSLRRRFHARGRLEHPLAVPIDEGSRRSQRWRPRLTHRSAVQVKQSRSGRTGAGYLAGNEDSVARSIRLEAERTTVQGPLVKQASSERVRHVVGTAVRGPLEADGVQPEGLIVQTDVEPADGASPLVFFQDLDTEGRAVGPLWVPLGHAPVPPKASGNPNVVVVRRRKVPREQLFDRRHNQARVRGEQLVDLSRESANNAPFPKFLGVKIPAGRGCQSLVSRNLPEPVVPKSSERVDCMPRIPRRPELDQQAVELRFDARKRDEPPSPLCDPTKRE